MNSITALYTDGEIEKVLKEAGMSGFVPGAIRLEDADALMQAASRLNMITDSGGEVSVIINTGGDLFVSFRLANGVRLMSEPIGDHFLKHLVHIDMSNVVIANRLLSWAVSEVVKVIETLNQHYKDR